MTKHLVQDVNNQHRAGSNSYGLTGVDFFDSKGLTANTISINSAIIGNSKNIAASANGETAASIASLQQEGTYSTKLEKVVFEIALAKRDTDSAYEIFSSEEESLNNRFKSETGVDVSEEVMELVKEQRAYNACAQYMKVITELIDVVIRMAD